MDGVLTEQRVARLEDAVGDIGRKIDVVEAKLAAQNTSREELKQLFVAGIGELKELIKGRATEDRERFNRFEDQVAKRFDRFEARHMDLTGRVNALERQGAGILAHLKVPAAIIAVLMAGVAVAGLIVRIVA